MITRKSLLNETRRKPITGTRCPTLFDKWHGIYYIPSHTDTAGHTKAITYSVTDHWGGSQSAPAQGRFEPPTCRSTVEHANHQTTMTPQVGGSIIPRVLNGGDLLPIGRIVCENSPATCRQSPGKGAHILNTT